MPPFVHPVINTTLGVVVVTVAMMNEENRELGEAETMRTLGGGNDSYKRPSTGSTITIQRTGAASVGHHLPSCRSRMNDWSHAQCIEDVQMAGIADRLLVYEEDDVRFVFVPELTNADPVPFGLTCREGGVGAPEVAADRRVRAPLRVRNMSIRLVRKLLDTPLRFGTSVRPPGGTVVSH